jgi:hypothetical protein
MTKLDPYRKYTNTEFAGEVKFGPDIEDNFACPACNARVHPIHVTVTFGASVTEIDRERVIGREVPVAERAHGWDETTAIRLRCEHCALISELIIRFHKGSACIEMREVGVQLVAVLDTT